MSTEIIKGSCVDCGFRAVCDEAKNKKRKCTEYTYSKWLDERMTEHKLDPASNADKKKMLELERMNTVDNARSALYVKGFIFVLLLLAAALWTIPLWFPKVEAFFLGVETWFAARNINFWAATLVIVGAIVVAFVIRSVLRDVAVLCRQNARWWKEVIRDCKGENGNQASPHEQ